MGSQKLVFLCADLYSVPLDGGRNGPATFFPLPTLHSLFQALKQREGRESFRVRAFSIQPGPDSLGAYNLGQNKWKKPRPPPPLPTNQGWENGAFWLLRDFILDLGGGGGGAGNGGLLFHFISSKIVEQDKPFTT